LFVCFLKVLFILFERERERVVGRARGREREADSLLIRKPDAELDPRTWRS